MDTGYPSSTVVPDVPEAATFRNFILDAINDLPQGGVLGAGGVPYNNADAGLALTRLREGGRDER